MAQPARKFRPEEDSTQRWQARIITGGGEGGGERPNLSVIQGGDDHTPQTPSQEQATKNQRHLSLVPALREAETKAAQGPSGTSNINNQESRINLGNYKDFYNKSAQNRAQGGKRGIFIGLGAGGGIVSVVAGFSFMLPFKLPGIMNTIIDNAGERFEKIVERRAERVFLEFILRGTAAAGTNGKLIITGNPLGDLFANYKTANFEADLKKQFGLEFKPGPNKTIKLVHNGTDLGDAGTPDEILKILDGGKSLSRSDLRKILRSTQTWGFFKRAKFVKWLALKYNIPRFGAREIEPGESEDEYNKAVKKDHIDVVETNGSLRNAADLINCISSGDGKCPDLDKTKGGQEFLNKTREAFAKAGEELAADGIKKSITTVVKAASTKLAALTATGVGIVIMPIDMVVRIQHFAGGAINSDLLLRKHAEYVGRSSAVLATNLAGHAHQSMAGDLPASTVGMFADQFDGWETSATYNLIDSGKAVGERLEPMERVNETATQSEAVTIFKGMFNTVGLALRAPMELWRITISPIIDGIEAIPGAINDWILEHTPAKQIIEKITPYIADVFEALFKFIGMSIDPLAVGPKLAMYVHQGFLVAFNGLAQELGMRHLSHSQALLIDEEIRQDRLADMADASFYDRILNMHNPASLATRIATTIPGTSSPALAFASSSARLVVNAPRNFASVTSGRAYAAEESVTIPEELFDIKMYGGTTADLAAPLDPSVESTQPVTCPENRDDAFNHCKLDPEVVDSMSCPHVKCADMNLTSEFDPIFINSYRQPLGYIVRPLFSDIHAVTTPAKGAY